MGTINIFFTFIQIAFVYVWSSGKALGSGVMDECSSPSSDTIFSYQNRILSHWAFWRC